MHTLFWRGFQHEKQVVERANRALQAVYALLDRSEAEFIRRCYTQVLEHLAENEPEPSLDESAGFRLPVRSILKLQRSAPLDTKLWMPPEAIEFYRPIRIELIRRAIRKGTHLPDHLLREYPREQFLGDFSVLPGHQRAYHKAVTGQLGEIDDSLLESHGVWLRRQDGNPPTENQRKAIKKSLDEVYLAVGDLSRLCRITHLTISHTNGKQLYQTPRTHAIYRPIYQMISLAVNGNAARTGLDCLAHELAGHWLDYASVPLQRWIDRMMTKEQAFHREFLCTSFLDAMVRKERTVYPELLHRMAPYPLAFERELPDLFTPSEVWARAVEQWIADRLHRLGIRQPVSAKPVNWYYDRPGYWPLNEWRSVIRRLVQDGLKARLWMARRVNGLSESRTRKPPKSYRQVFPWVDELDLQFFGHHLAERYLPRDWLE